MSLLEEQAKQSDVDAQTLLGAKYLVEGNDNQAAYWFRKAAEQGDALSQHNLGAMYTTGQGVLQSHEHAVYWYRKMKVNAAELDDTVLTIIKKQAEVVLNTADLSGFRKINADGQRIDECEKQIRYLIEQQQICYERFIRQELVHDDFYSQKSGYSEQIERLNNQLALLGQLERDKEANKRVASVAREALSETAAPKDIVSALVDKIFVAPGNQIEIRWKFADFAMAVN